MIRTRPISWLENFCDDVRFGFRMLRKSPGYTSAAVVALGLGIGLNTALFMLFNSLVFRELPVAEPERVVKAVKQSAAVNSFSYTEYQYLRTRSNAFEALSAWARGALRMGTEPVMASFVSSDYFSMMRVRPAVGRNLDADDELNIAPPHAAMLSENFWEQRFGRDSGVLGSQVLLSDIPVVIVGITPRDFTGSRFEAPDVWLPLAARQTARCCGIEGRLKTGVSLQQAQAELEQITSAFQKESPSPDLWKIDLEPVTPRLEGKGIYYIYGVVLQPALAMVLLIACANVGGLLLGKAVSRQKEIAVRLSVGASRWRLIQQWLTEALLLAQLATFLSLLMTWWILRFAVGMVLPVLQRYDSSNGGSLVINVTPDVRVVLYAFGVSVLTAVIFALAPALQATGSNASAGLKDDGSGQGSPRRYRLHRVIVAVQVAICMTLLIVAGTLVRSAAQLLTIDPGFDAKHVLSVSIRNPASFGYSEGRIKAFNLEVKSRLEGLPSVTSIASSSRMPLGGGSLGIVITPAAGPRGELSRAPRYPFTFVSSAYFETLGIRLLQGRAFTPQEMLRPASVAVISDSLGKRLWPGELAVGKMITVGSSTNLPGIALLFLPSVEVVGVARDVNSNSLVTPDAGALYLPSQEAQWEGNFFIRTSGDPRALVSDLSNQLRSIDRHLSVNVQTMDSVVQNDHGVIVVRVFGSAFSAIGLLGLVLASVGIYSMVGYTVSQQTREVGIRMALGAQKKDVLILVMGTSIRPIAIGVISGFALGVGISLILSSQSSGLRVPEAWVLAAIPLLPTITALMATYLPTRKAMNLDPSVALRAR